MGEMGLRSRLQARFMGWRHNTPLPKLDEKDTAVIFQSWHEFDSSSSRWIQLSAKKSTAGSYSTQSAQDIPLALVTWNINGTDLAPDIRTSAIVTHIRDMRPVMDVIFLQEVTRTTLSVLLAMPWVREQWYSSEADATSWGHQSISTMTLLSKSRFHGLKCTPERAALGAVWRVPFPSHFGRDALCCDIFLPICTPSECKKSVPGSHARIRLVNVHLDSLAIQPSYRPRQLSIIASYLRAAGRGLVAGDFNPVLPEDDSLINENNLVDVWTELRPNDPGFTWGIDGKQAYPANRLDKVAKLGLKTHEIEVIPPGTCTYAYAAENRPEEREHKWSDHCGLKCSFGLGD
ncbi:hypothetical protein CIHG_08519 [Coccidioides immitis H538.4]|uniref:Endonuclease/exonuclease/phosphatase domain-containing protein n=2 Tax=Coccidioides immitis TaxID=5501 RepID=A0A0J8UT31_COCIT|nr:hypothetical protein CIRG_09717 [Coccidioides immitis RMSCC 2394]KMU90863.1 hypothetical protein CIHG_08519 [Coccidioides immitis H538.4]